MNKFTAKPKLTVDIVATNEEGATSTVEIKEGVILQDCAFKEGTGIVTKTGKVTEIMVAAKKVANDYTKCPCMLESQFDDAVTVDGFVLDASNIYGSDVSMVFVKDLRSIGAVVEGGKTVDIENAQPGEIADAISKLQPGQELVLSGAGEITEDIVIPAGAVVRGANAGVSAASGYRAQNGVIEGETVISGNLTVTGSDIVLDGVTLTGKALPRIGDAVTTLAEDTTVEGKDVNFSLNNCRIVNLDDGSGASKQYGIKPLNWNDNVKMEVTGCYFGENAPAMYNLMELNCNLQSGSVFKNNYFAKGAFKNNAICIYQVANGAFISIENNIFEYSANAVRVGTKGNTACTIDVKNNTYMETMDPEIDEAGNITSNWGGIMIIQPYGKKTESMKNVIVNLTGTKSTATNPQLWYYYQDKATSKLEVEDRPKVYVDGQLDTYEGKSWLFE